jgi:very-short-patch-repair endonuclease
MTTEKNAKPKVDIDFDSVENFRIKESHNCQLKEDKREYTVTKKVQEGIPPCEGGERECAVNKNIKEGVRKLLAEGNHNIHISAFSKAGILKYNFSFKEKVHKLRYAGNLPEVLLWNQLKRDALKVDFHRQKAIGNYIVDFFCPELMLAIEIDGNEHSYGQVGEYDDKRQKELEACGIEFLRFPAADVLNKMESVVENIKIYVRENKIHEKLSQVERAVYNKNKHLFIAKHPLS